MKVWTDKMVDQMIDQMIDLTRRGFTMKEIGNRLGVSFKSVGYKRDSLRRAGDPRMPIAGADHSPIIGAGYVGRPVSNAPAPIVSRDPCWRCGVRGDVGCAHQPAAIAA